MESDACKSLQKKKRRAGAIQLRFFFSDFFLGRHHQGNSIEYPYHLSSDSFQQKFKSHTTMKM